MRSVRIVVRKMAGSVPALVAASLFGSTACGESSSTPPHGGSGGSASAGSAAGGIAGSGVLIISGSSSTPGAAGSTSDLPPSCTGYVVQLPDVGTPAVAGEICTVDVEPVISNDAARVSLTVVDADPRAPALGTLTLAPALRDQVRGAPVLQIVAATDSRLLATVISPLEPTDDGFSFTVTWPKEANLRDSDLTRVSFRTALELSCATGGRLVQATTEVHLCGGFSGGDAAVPATWASTGDTCVVCNVIAELAASPIIPDHEQSSLPLGQALRARIVELLRVGDGIVLFAENDGGAATNYEWHATGGALEHIADDLVIFRSDGTTPAPSLQVAITNDDGVAVVSYSYPGGAH
jgi:hypothetical protein